MWTAGRSRAVRGAASVLVIVGVLLICIRGCKDISLAEPVVLAGSETVYQELWQHTTSVFTFGHSRAEMLGLVRVDLTTGESTFLRGRGFDLPCRFDARGRRFRFRVSQIHMDDFAGSHRVLRAGLFYQNLCLAVDDEATWAFFIERPDLWKGPCTLVRVNAETGVAATLPMPEDLTEFPSRDNEVLSAQNRDVAFLSCGNRTWRGDFTSRSWGEPIDGSFRVIDSRGTLLEHRSASWLAGTRTDSDSRIFIIRDGVREEIDIGHGGWGHPVFDTGYVRLHDRGRDRYIFRSHEGKPDILVPRRPKDYEGKPELR
jgi:hypothetical protein